MKVEDQIFALLTEVRVAQIADGKTLVKLETEQTHLSKGISAIDSRVSIIEESIIAIKETDIEQTNDLRKHMRRTKLNEELIDIVKKKFLSFSAEVNNRYYNDSKKILKKEIENESVKDFIKTIKDNVWWIVTIIGIISGIVFGIIKLV